MEWINSSHMGETTLIPQISISTITTTLKLNCTFNLVDIYKCVKLDANKIIGFKCNGWVKIKLGENIVYLPPNILVKYESNVFGGMCIYSICISKFLSTTRSTSASDAKNS